MPLYKIFMCLPTNSIYIVASLCLDFKQSPCPTALVCVGAQHSCLCLLFIDYYHLAETVVSDPKLLFPIQNMRCMTPSTVENSFKFNQA